MIVRVKSKSTHVTVNSKAGKSARSELKKNGINATSKRSAPGMNAAGVRKRKQPYPDKAGVRFFGNDAIDHFRKHPIDSSALPPEITPSRFRQAMLQAVSELGDEEGATTSGLLGRCWEILGAEFPQARQHCNSAVMDSLDILDFLAKELPDLGFHSGIGEFDDVPMKHMKKMLDAIENNIASGPKLNAKDRKLAVRKALFKSVEYVEDFKINGQKYHDGCFVMKLGDYWLMLVPTEFKTAGSKGVRGQMMVSQIRFAGVAIDSIVTFRRKGVVESTPIHSMISNPLYREAVGIKAASEDGGYLMSDAITKSVSKRIDSSHNTRDSLARNMRTLHDLNLEDYASLSALVKVKADLQGMRAYIYNFLHVVPKRKK